MPLSASIRRRPKSPSERLYEAALAYANADGDDDYFRARDNLRKAAAAASPAIRAEVDRELRSELTKKGLERVRAAGVHIGRPSKVHPAIAEKTVESVGSIDRAAALLRVSPSTIFRALKRVRGGLAKGLPF